jgi:thiamine kinase-like enzyme
VGCALLALFVLVCGARLWLVDTCGSSVPFWDQWDAEGDALFAPLLRGNLPLASFFEPHCEHRIVPTRFLAFGLFKLDGMWDPRLEMAVNAAIAAGTAAIVAGLLLREIGRRWWRPVICAVAILWALPFAWDNTTMGLASHFYFLLLFSFLAIWGLCYGRPYTIAWWIGAASAILSCLTMASGFLAPLAVLFVLAAAVMLERKTWRMHLPGFMFCLLCVVASVPLIVKVPKHDYWHSAGPQYFVISFLKNLSWPAHLIPAAFVVFLFPVFFMARALVRLPSQQPRPRWFLIGLAVWVALQAGAFAYGRGRLGDGPATRYQDVLALGPLVALAALLLESGSMRRKVWCAALAGWLICMLPGIRQTVRDFTKDLPNQRRCAAEQARRCRAYVETRDPEVLRHTADPQEIPYPNPERLARLLDDPQIRSVLLFVPGQEDKAAWPTCLARGLLRASRWILLLGLLGLVTALWPLRVSKRGASSIIGEALVQHLKRNFGLAYFGKNKDETSHPLYLFKDRKTKEKRILKKLNPTDSEVKVYREYLPLIKSPFPALVLPEPIAVFNFEESAYVLLPYYEGEHFLHNSNDLQLATDLVNIAFDLSTIDAVRILKDKSAFDQEEFESKFWHHFEKACALGFVKATDTTRIKSECAKVLALGGRHQTMVVCNGDFNPRNVIRLRNGRLVLLDWNGAFVSPLEHLLAYPWLLNWENPAWQKAYAAQFEGKLPVDNNRLRMHLMNDALFKAVDEKRHGNVYGDKMSEDHLKKFCASFSSFQSLTELS